MANSARGEIDAMIGGQRLTLCLTLGALSELESKIGLGDLSGLAERVAQGRLSSRDVMAVLGAGLRGAGNVISDDDLARLSIEGGLLGAVEIATRLVDATFGETL